MREVPSAPGCLESASVCQSQLLRDPSSTGVRGRAALSAAVSAVAQLLSCDGETLGIAPMSAYQACAPPRATATVLTQGMADSSRWMVATSSSVLAWLQRSQTRNTRKFSALMSRIAKTVLLFQPNAALSAPRLTIGPCWDS